MSRKKQLSFLIPVVIVAFILFNKFVGWNWLDKKESAPIYSEKEYNLAGLETEWMKTPLNEQGDFVFRKTKEFLNDTLTDSEEYKINYLLELLTTSDTTNFNSFTRQLLQKENGKNSLFKELYRRVDEETDNELAKAENSLNYANLTTNLAFFRTLFQHPKRDNKFLETCVNQIGEYQTKGSFVLGKSKFKLSLQRAIRDYVIIPNYDLATYKTAQERFSKEELETLNILFTPNLVDHRGVVLYDEVRDYLAGKESTYLKK